MSNDRHRDGGRVWVQEWTPPSASFLAVDPPEDLPVALSVLEQGVVVRVGAVGKVIVVVDAGIGVGPGSVMRLA